MTTITIKHEGTHWLWTLEVNGEEHEGRSQTLMESAAGAEHLRSALWWKRNRGKPDNSDSTNAYERPQKPLTSIHIGNTEKQ